MFANLKSTGYSLQNGDESDLASDEDSEEPLNASIPIKEDKASAQQIFEEEKQDDVKQEMSLE